MPGAGKLYTPEAETEIAQIELTDLNNWKAVASKDEKAAISKNERSKGEKRKNPNHE